MKQSNLITLFTLLLLLALLALPMAVLAQEPESTEAVPEATEQAPVTVIVESPPIEDSGGVSQNELLIAGFLVLSLLFNAVQAFWGKGSIPPNVANEIFAGLRVLSKSTKTEDDDKLIDAGEAAYNALMPKAPPEEKPRD